MFGAKATFWTVARFNSSAAAFPALSAQTVGASAFFSQAPKSSRQDACAGAMGKKDKAKTAEASLTAIVFWKVFFIDYGTNRNVAKRPRTKPSREPHLPVSVWSNTPSALDIAPNKYLPGLVRGCYLAATRLATAGLVGQSNKKPRFHAICLVYYITVYLSICSHCAIFDLEEGSKTSPEKSNQKSSRGETDPALEFAHAPHVKIKSANSVTGQVSFNFCLRSEMDIMTGFALSYDRAPYRMIGRTP